MSPVSLLPILPILAVALCVVSLLSRVLKIKYQKHRYTSIDGLRGFLAMCVFLHHSTIWFFFLRTHEWYSPPSNVYSNFGPTSVGLFFMITALLFFSKLIDATGGDFDWVKLYVSRVLRIVPLYLLAVAIIFLMAGFITHFVLKEHLENIFLEWVQWLFFIEADINRIFYTRLLVAGVVWSLAFEWMFYFSLGFIGALFFRLRISFVALFSTTLFFILFIFIIFQFYPVGAWNRMSPFLGGIVAALLVRNKKILDIGSSMWITPLLLALSAIALVGYPTVFEPVPFLCMTVLFIAIACGNNLFGVLTHKACCLLGQISYSIYLLHGIILFITFRFVLGFSKAAKLSPLAHWGVIMACSIVVVTVCTLTYYFVEKPCIDSAGGAAKKIKRLLVGPQVSGIKAGASTRIP